MSTPQATESEHTEVVDGEAAYRQYIADLIMSYASQNRALDNAEAYRRVMSITGRTLTTVKNWLHYKTNLPDLASIARMVRHWQIPAHQIFSHVVGDDQGIHPSRPSSLTGSQTVAVTSQLLVSPYSQRDQGQLDRALAKYTDRPRTTLFVRYDSSDMLDEIRPGELMLVDPTCEELSGSGLYLLRFGGAGARDITCVRKVDVLLGEPAVRLSGGSAAAGGLTETVRLENGSLPHVTVLAKVMAVMRQT